MTDGSVNSRNFRNSRNLRNFPERETHMRRMTLIARAYFAHMRRMTLIARAYFAHMRRMTLIHTKRPLLHLPQENPRRTPGGCPILSGHVTSPVGLPMAREDGPEVIWMNPEVIWMNPEVIWIPRIWRSLPILPRICAHIYQ